LGERSYDIVVEPDALAGIGEEVAACGPFSRAVVITAPVLAETWGVAAVDDLCAHGIPADMLVIPPGEKQKSLARAGRICERMVELGADRRSVVVALGGGVIGDLSGFVAATYMRGIAMVQAPTTLLAQVDSSLGGKVAVNLPQGKNLVGAFHQPRLVLIDPVVLRTLPRRELRGGMAEVIKSGVIADARLFTYLEDHRRELLRREPFALRHVIRGCCEIKAAVVGQDEREETGCRATLNFGHTIGHAIESLGAGAYRHGEAVAIGMVAAGRLAVATGRWSAEEQGRMAALLENVGLPVRARGQAPADILARMRADKKNVAGRLHLVLPTRLGHVELVTDVDEDALMRVLEEICEEDR
jgi:3-dehydroquinate synthase